jgi:hypothetical protein
MSVFHEWHNTADWRRFTVTWHDCPRIAADDIDRDRRSMGDGWVQQEYECLFTALEGLVYHDFARAVLDLAPPVVGKPVGGIDFGWRNPFAAVWGVLDRDDVLWILWERYLRETPLFEHVLALKKRAPRVTWYADPAGRTETEELRAAGLTVRRGDNDIRLGIAAVTARLRTGRLKVLSTQCWNLVAESKLYRYPTAQERPGQRFENPVDDHNHALGALRYLISRIDHKFIARLRKQTPTDGAPEVEAVDATALDRSETYAALHGARPWLRLDNEALWDN